MSKIFENKETMPSDNTDRRAFRIDDTPIPDGTPIAVTMTPERERPYRAASYPASNAMSVRNIKRPRFGHGY